MDEDIQLGVGSWQLAISSGVQFMCWGWRITAQIHQNIVSHVEWRHGFLRHKKAYYPINKLFSVMLFIHSTKTWHVNCKFSEYESLISRRLVSPENIIKLVF